MHLKVLCPAKINLFLSVGPRDEKGYHPLRSIFQAVNLYDELRIKVKGAQDVLLHDLPWMPEENTLTKALRLLRQEIDFPALEITLKKRIPPQSGLGGGSSDAAGVIRAVLALSGLAGQEQAFIPMAANIGADVPFFLLGGRAYAEGYGERLTPLEDVRERWMVIARPSVGCSTPEMFTKLDALSYEWAYPLEEDILYNDFMRVMPDECSQFASKLQAYGADDASLSGSGSAVFARFPGFSEAETAAGLLRNEQETRVWVVRNISRAELVSFDVFDEKPRNYAGLP